MTNDLSPADKAKLASAQAAVALVENGMKLGLGTGSTAAFMVKVLAERVRTEGLDIIGVPTSTRTAELGRSLGLRIVTLEEAGELDLTIDGADEFDGDLTLVKGGGGALLQEKIVATASKRMVVITDPAKQVAHLGAFPLPVEVIPFGWQATATLIARVLEAQGMGGVQISRRMIGVDTDRSQPFRTDENNYILDLHLGRIADARALSLALNQIAGVVENGLFIDIADTVIIGLEDGTARLVTRG